MNWEAAGAIGEIIGAAAVFATLVYLAAQIRQNTKAVRAAALDAAVTHVTSARQSLYSSEALTDIYVRGNDDPHCLTKNELVRFRLLVHAILQSLSNVRAQAELTGLSQSDWDSQVPILRRIVSTPGGEWFWKEFGNEFDEEFRREVNELLASHDELAT
jgi:hypothetical protein